ncbi:unnamed protein product [Auanema sp. JU1783]|nr:unnamed protein product [Auanema sp. JU1783]
MPLDCKLCNISFSTNLEQKEHNLLLSHHVKLASTGSSAHNCIVCVCKCQSLADYSKHVDTPEHRRRLERLRAKIDTDERESPPKKPRTNSERMDNTYMEPSTIKKDRKESHPSSYSSRSVNKYSSDGYSYRSAYNNDRSSDSYRNDRNYSEKRHLDRNSSRSSYHGYSKDRYQDNYYSKDRSDRNRSRNASPQTDEPKKNMFQRACNLSMRKKDKPRKPVNPEEDQKLAKSTSEKKVLPKTNIATVATIPIKIQIPKKKRGPMPGPSIQNQTEKQKSWKKLAKSVIGKKQSDLVRRDRASKYRLLDKKGEELSEEDGIMSELPYAFQVPNFVNNSLYNLMNDSSATYASVANFPMSTPYNYPTAIQAYDNGNDNLSQVLGEIERAKSIASTSSFSTPSSADPEALVKPSLDEPPLNSEVVMEDTVVIKNEVPEENNVMSFPLDVCNPSQPIEKPTDVDKKNELWDLAVAEEMKKKELEVYRERVVQLESDLLRISKRKTDFNVKPHFQIFPVSQQRSQ